MKIEPATGADAGEIMTLQRAAFLTDAQITGNPFLPSLTETVADLHAVIADPEWIFLKATIGYRIVGSVRGHMADRVVDIGRLMTAPDQEGQGIGSALLNAIEEIAAPRVDWFELATGVDNARNIAMYARRGYVEIERVEMSSGVVAVVMRKPAAELSTG